MKILQYIVLYLTIMIQVVILITLFSYAGKGYTIRINDKTYTLKPEQTLKEAP